MGFIWRMRLAFVGALGALVLAACGHDHPSGDSALPVLDTETQMVTVTLPAGTSVALASLKVVTSIDSEGLSGSGSAAVRIYSGSGSQLAIVVSPAGNPMLMGWVDSTHQTIDAATTADVLAYFALGGGTFLNSVDTQALIAGIPSASGIDALAQTVQSELVANADAFGQSDAKLAAAVSAFATPLFTAAGSVSASGTQKRVKAITITPDVQSGVTVLQIDPFSAALQNALRRRAYAFVDRVSYTTAGAETPDPATVTQFEVAPVVGVNGGVTGALTDIMNAYYGNQPTAYAPIISPSEGSFATPLVSGSDKTTYQVTLVGPGFPTAVSGTLTAEQSSALTDVAIRGFVKDLLVPTLANGILGSGLIDFSAGQAKGSPKAAFLAAVLTSFTTDFTAFLATAPGVRDKIVKGQWLDAGVDLTTSATASNSIRTILINAFEKASAAYTARGWKPGATSDFFAKFDEILNFAGGVLQAYDLVWYGRDLAHASSAVQWTIVAVRAGVKVNPSSSTVGVGGSSTLIASVNGADGTAGYSYEWSTTTNTTDDLHELDGLGRVHQTDYCSVSPKTSYDYELDAVDGTVDTVTVKVWDKGNCGNGSGQYLGSGTVTVTVQKDITVSISPANPTVAPNSTSTFTVSTQGTTLSDKVSYQWTLSGTGSIGSSNPATTQVPTISYTAPASGSDTLTVTILAADGTHLGSAQDTINTVKEGAALTFTASSGSACCGGYPPGTYSTDTVPTASYGSFCANYACNPRQYGLVVGWGIGGTLRLALPAGTFITGTGSWTMWAGILDTVQPGQFLFMSDTSDNIGNVTITTLTPLSGGQQLATFTFTEGSSSPSSTRTYAGAGSFIIPAPPAGSH